MIINNMATTTMAAKKVKSHAKLHNARCERLPFQSNAMRFWSASFYVERLDWKKIGVLYLARVL